MSISWLSFTPAYRAPRGRNTTILGAHAFRDEAPLSLCGCVERERAGEKADDAVRHCFGCDLVVAGRATDRSYTGRPWALRPVVAASPEPPAQLDSLKPYAPGSDPLAPLPFTAAERANLVRRVQEAIAAKTARGSIEPITTMDPKRLATLRSERAAERDRALAYARSLCDEAAVREQARSQRRG